MVRRARLAGPPAGCVCMCACVGWGLDSMREKPLGRERCGRRVF